MRTIIFDKITGEIVMAAKGSENDCLSSLRQLGLSRHSYIEGAADPAVQYVDVATEELRDKHTFAPSIAGNVVSNLPEGTIIRMPDRTVVTVDATGAVELEVDHPETITLQLRHLHYLEAEIAVDCTP